MCGIAGIFGPGWKPEQLHAMVASQHHRGPDDRGIHINPEGTAGLGHNRLSIIDLSSAGHQPMWSHDNSAAVVFNGEIYNYIELRRELSGFPFRSRSDTEVILAAWERWGESCVEHFIGMFAFLLWDERRQQLFAARDRFGVKPLYYSTAGGTLFAASEIKALHCAGVPAAPDETAWATYLATGFHESTERTFWKDIQSLPAGHRLTWTNGELRVVRWYDLAAASGLDFDSRSVDLVEEEYLHLLLDSVRLRFRSDVRVGINLSGGLDSSTLLGLVHAIQGPDSEVTAFTFATGDPNYDETPWVERMLDRTRHQSMLCRLSAAEVPALAVSVQKHQDEPFGGLPTLAYARLFEVARAEQNIVLLDGQGMDEQWAGYDYYARALSGENAGIVQGSGSSPVRPDCLLPEFRQIAAPVPVHSPFPDALRNLQYRDSSVTKIPRALRFNDRISMRSSTELREPFLDHRLFELALRQPPERKIALGCQKWLLRRITANLLPAGVVEAPKRPLQTPQREWLRGSLKLWAEDCIEHALASWGSAWLDSRAVRQTWQAYCRGESDNSFYVWQWVSIGMMADAFDRRAVEAAV